MIDNCGRYTYDLYRHGLYSYGLCHCGMYSYGQQTQRVFVILNDVVELENTSAFSAGNRPIDSDFLQAHIVMAYIVMVSIVMASIENRPTDSTFCRQLQHETYSHGVIYASTHQHTYNMHVSVFFSRPASPYTCMSHTMHAHMTFHLFFRMSHRMSGRIRCRMLKLASLSMRCRSDLIT